MHSVYLALGTNLGTKEENMATALDNITKRIGKVIACSAFYVTAPVGFDSENHFLNAACSINTDLSPLQLLKVTKDIEITMGRMTKTINSIHTDRIIDIDILLYDNLILHHADLILPHAHLHERDFVLQPLVEIAENVVHPVLGKTMKELLTARTAISFP